MAVLLVFKEKGQCLDTSCCKAGRSASNFAICPLLNANNKSLIHSLSVPFKKSNIGCINYPPPLVPSCYIQQKKHTNSPKLAIASLRIVASARS